MKVLIPEEKANFVRYDQVKPGEVFWWKQILCIRSDWPNSIVFETGQRLVFEACDLVLKTEDFVLAHKSMLKDGYWEEDDDI